MSPSKVYTGLSGTRVSCALSGTGLVVLHDARHQFKCDAVGGSTATHALQLFIYGKLGLI